MTTRNKASLALLFEQGDVPTGTDFADFVDSYVNVAETSAQTILSPLTVTELITPRVSANNANITGTLSAGTFSTNVLNASAATITASLSAGDVWGDRFRGSAATLTGKLTGATASFSGLVSADAGVKTTTVSADSIGVTGDINAATGRINASAATFSGNVSANGLVTTLSVQAFGIISTGGARIAGDVSADTSTVYASATRWGKGVVSAAGTVQGTAAPLIFTINEGKGVADGTTTGFGLLANKNGWVQYIFNRGASANLWPPTGGQINGLAADAVFPLAASAMFTIVHLGASAYAVK